MSDVEVFLDDVDFSGCALEGSVTRRLNRPAQAQVKIPMDCAAGCSGPGQRLKISFLTGTYAPLFFHGMVMDWELDGGEDTGYITMNAMDPMELWQWRVARDYDSITPGNFVDPYFTKTIALGGKETGPQMIESMLQASENPALIPTAAEGPLFLTLGTFEAGGVDLSGIPSNWPMTIAEVTNLLVSTGEVDVVITPTDTGLGGNMGRVDAYNGDYGNDLSGSVVFEYGTGALNVRALRWNQDMSNVNNKNQYFFGPKETTRRYKANITGDDPCLPYPPGGATSPPNSPTNNPLGVLRQDSQDLYGVRMQMQIFDVDVIYTEDHPACLFLDPTRTMYRRLWQIESWLRALPRTLIHITPTRGTEIGSFDIGDLVGVEIGSGICGGASGAQRVYQYTTSWTPDGPLELSELQTSSDQEGF